MKITSVKGVLVGHSTHPQEATGCTVILCPEGATAGVDIRGSAPGTRETELLRTTFMVRKIHGVVLTGGSAFGLRTVDGVMQYLYEKGIGYRAGEVIVPIVPAAVIFDLNPTRRVQIPDAQMGYQAAESAATDYEEGLVGAGRGATVGKILGMDYAMNGGLATWGMKIGNGIYVGALVVVNALGDVVNPETGKIVAGARNPNGAGFLNTFEYMTQGSFTAPIRGTNTTLAVVVTNAGLDKEMINKVAQMAQNGIARATSPAHTMFDGDVVFALSVGDQKADVNIIGEAAAVAVSRAIVKAVQLTNPIEKGIP